MHEVPDGQLELFDDTIDADFRLPCGCPADVPDEDLCTGWHWPRSDWDPKPNREGDDRGR